MLVIIIYVCILFGRNMDDVQLTEGDIEGAALNGKHPKQLTCEQLRFWLACRGFNAKKLKTKNTLIARYYTFCDIILFKYYKYT